VRWRTDPASIGVYGTSTTSGESQMNTHSRLSGIALLAFVLIGSGCAGMSDRQRDTAVGAGVGAVGGAVLTGGSAVGTVGGAVVGGVIGNEVGKGKK
jgi:osmotically inducible lipoprotein OsmB